MIPIQKIKVALKFDDADIEVGELLQNEHRIFFKFFQSFVTLGLDISPIKLGLQLDIKSADAIPFEGLFGVFADSLPDGWGALLLDRALSAKGININNVTPLDRLAYVGNTGMGALIYQPHFELESQLNFKLELDKIALATKKIIEGKPTNVLDDIYKLGGSSGGARPKILVGYNAQTEHIVKDNHTLPNGYEHWIIKFPSSLDKPDIANIEMAYYNMALDAGITMNTSQLFTTISGKQYFGTKRFDRINNTRLHLHSAAGLMHDNFRYSNMDYGNIMDCAFRLEKNVYAYEKVLRLAAFNVFANNRDDHSKNFSFLMNKNGEWQLAPAYDLTFATSGHGMHSTMIAGESANPNHKHLSELGNYFKIKNTEKIIKEVKDVIMNWNYYADKNNVSTISKKAIAKIICK
jgi:serine/threonine-protein kinase HipA